MYIRIYILFCFVLVVSFSLANSVPFSSIKFSTVRYVIFLHVCRNVCCLFVFASASVITQNSSSQHAEQPTGDAAQTFRDVVFQRWPSTGNKRRPQRRVALTASAFDAVIKLAASHRDAGGARSHVSREARAAVVL